MNPVPQWSPGRIPVAVSGGGLIALDDEPALVVRLWEAMEAGAPLADLLRELAGAHGGDVFSLPDFLAAVHEPGGLRVAARGRFRLVAHGPAGRDVVHAPGAIAWEETVLRADAVELLLDDDAGAPGGERLPLRSGVVRAGALRWSAAPGSAPAPSCGPARTAPEIDGPVGPAGSAEPAAPAGPAEPAAPVAAASPAAVPEPAGPAAPRPAGSAASPDAPAAPAPVPVPGGALTLGPEDLDAVLDAPPEPPSPDPARPGPGAAGAAPGAAGADDSPSLADAQAEFGHHFLSRPGGPPSPAELSGPVGAGPAPSAPDLILEVPSPSPAPTPAPRAEGAEDWVHDGRTVSPAQLRAMREAAGALPGSAPADGADTVLAVLCDQGHPNAVHAVSCRRCGGRLQTDSLRVPRPLLGRLRASTGTVVDLRHDVVVGRAPAATPRPGRPSPELLIITDADKSASKVHCAVRVEDWDLAVEDLGSSNGTFLLRPGRAPRRLAPHSPEPLAVGDVISLADAATLTVEDADE